MTIDEVIKQAEEIADYDEKLAVGEAELTNKEYQEYCRKVK